MVTLLLVMLCAEIGMVFLEPLRAEVKMEGSGEEHGHWSLCFYQENTDVGVPSFFNTPYFAGNAYGFAWGMGRVSVYDTIELEQRYDEAG